VINLIDWRDNLGIKGVLLIRDVYFIRYIDDFEEVSP
jgi:hypothetical protein